MTTTYIALLRGVNVGGKNKIKMADLRSALTSAGYEHVQTYIQSGNIVLASGAAPDAVRLDIEEQIRNNFGISSSVVLRTAEEFEQTIACCPYADIQLGEGESIHVAFLTDTPPQQLIDRLASSERNHDEFHVQGCEIYFLLRQSILDSKLVNSIPKSGQTITMRNWNTVKKLHALVEAMGS